MTANTSFVDSFLLDGMRLEKPINYMWNNKKTGKFSRWIKLGLIEIDENDTSSIEGYRSKVSRGVDCRLVVHNPKNSKKFKKWRGCGLGLKGLRLKVIGVSG